MRRQDQVEVEKKATCEKCFAGFEAEKLGTKCDHCGGEIVDPKKLPNY